MNIFTALGHTANTKADVNPELVGQFAFWAMREIYENKLPSTEVQLSREGQTAVWSYDLSLEGLSNFFLKSEDSLVSTLFHRGDIPGGYECEELKSILTAAQSNGTIGRLNPAPQIYFKVLPLAANHSLNLFMLDEQYAPYVIWARKRAREQKLPNKSTIQQ
jgi:hypothetical protein